MPAIPIISSAGKVVGSAFSLMDFHYRIQSACIFSLKSSKEASQGAVSISMKRICFNDSTLKAKIIFVTEINQTNGL